MDIVEDILEHHGIKGMKWGVRRTRQQLSNPTEVKIVAKPGRAIVTTGGRRNPTHDEAKEAAIARQKAKTSGLQALSNKEIQTIVTRMNLENQYAKLNPRKKRRGEDFVKELISDAAPNIALSGAKWYFEDSNDYRVQMGLKVAEGVVNARNNSQQGGKKKKK